MLITDYAMLLSPGLDFWGVDVLPMLVELGGCKGASAADVGEDLKGVL